MLINTTNMCLLLLTQLYFVIKNGGQNPEKIQKAHSLNLQIISTKLQLRYQ